MAEKKYSIAIIGSAKFKKSTVKSLMEEAGLVFAKVLFAPIDRLKISFEKGREGVYFKKKNILAFDVVFPRINATDRLLGEPLLELLRNSNAYCPVTLQGFKFSNNKYFTIKKLADQGLPVLDSSLWSSEQSMPSIEKKFSFPLVLKIVGGYAGKGVMLIDNKKQLLSILDTMHLYEECLSAQKFIAGKNSDIRS